MAPCEGQSGGGSISSPSFASIAVSISKFRNRAIAPREVSSIVQPETTEERLELNTKSTIKAVILHVLWITY